MSVCYDLCCLTCRKSVYVYRSGAANWHMMKEPEDLQKLAAFLEEHTAGIHDVRLLSDQEWAGWLDEHG